MPQTTTDYRLRCRTCGQTGLLSITSDTRGTSDKRGWSYATAGFIGLAVSWIAPSSSILRCNSCRSTEIEVEAPDKARN